MARRAFLQLNRLRIMSGGLAIFDEHFHEGVNIIRGQNGSGKSTLADFIFFILGGEFDDWKEAAGQCDEVLAEVETPRGKLTLKRRINSKQEPILVYFGPISFASESSTDGWEKFPIHRRGGRENFSQVMFRSILIPEAKSDGAANITMHQLLRLCYSDQRTPSTRLFRFEPFDTQNIREAVGNLICGVGDYKLYEVNLELRGHEKRLGDIQTKLQSLQSALLVDRSLNCPELINEKINSLRTEYSDLRQQMENVDILVKIGKVNEYLANRQREQKSLDKQDIELKTLDSTEKNLDFELREIREFLAFLGDLKEKLSFAEATFDAVGSIEFTRCPACGEEIDANTPKNHCVVCKSPLDAEKEKSRYNQIRLDLEIQTRESSQLIDQKQSELKENRRLLRRLRREHERCLAEFEMKYSGGNSPREEFLAKRVNRLGHIDAEIDFLLKSVEIADEISRLNSEKTRLAEIIDDLKARITALEKDAQERRLAALTLISDFGTMILSQDIERQPEFREADNVDIDFKNDSISVGGLVNFAESSNVILKNTAILSLFLAAGKDPMFNHPRFLLIDNIEDKGMEEIRSHNFQRIVVEHATEIKMPYQVIFTTSMMNPKLELDDYTIGPAYTSDNRSLDFRKEKIRVKFQNNQELSDAA